MNKINWFPEYWNFIEKTKLFDFWRNRYCKNKIYFSPNKENCGGVGFYDASYESLKFDNDKYRYEKVEKEYLERREFLFKELEESQVQDKKRLVLLIEAEEKAFDYWKAKIILKPIEDDVPEILKQSIWLIDEKERVFKETLSYLIEYDRKHLSPLTYPERSLSNEPLSISESYHWLIRENRLFGTKDMDFFNKHLNDIKLLNKMDFFNIEFKPEVLIERHNRNIKKEERQNLKRTKNGELLETVKNENNEVFERPVVIYSNELKEESVISQIKKFKEQDLNQYKTDYENDILIFESDKYQKNTFNSIFEKKGSNIPKNPYILIQKNIFDLINAEDELSPEKQDIISQLKKHIQERNRGLKEHYKKREKSETKSGLLNTFLYFFFKGGKIEVKELNENDKIKLTKNTLEKDGIVFLAVDDEKEKVEDVNVENKESDEGEEGGGLEEAKRGYWDAVEDDFDDKTRFNFFIRDKNGLHFNRKALIGKFLKNRNNLLNKFKNTAAVKTKAILNDLKSKLSKEPNKVKLGLEKSAEILANKMAALEFKDQLNEIKNKHILKEEIKQVLSSKVEYPKYKMK